MTGEELALLGRTAAHLRPAQVAHRARLRAQRAALQRWPATGRLLVTSRPPARIRAAAVPTARSGATAEHARTGWPADYAPLDATALSVTVPRHWPSLAELRAGQIRLLGMTQPLGDWQQADAPQLWRFHLHYWDWAWGLAAEPDRVAARQVFARLWRSWRLACTFGRGDAWLPYPAALRAWSWCGLYRHLVAGTDLDAEFRRELAAHAGFLRLHLESDVGGNHLIKDLKALVGLGVFLGDEPLLRRALRLLIAQLAVQVLPDGGHYERAPAYHCQVLADLIDVAGLLRGRPGDGPGADRGDRPDAPLARRGAGPGRRGAAAQRRLPGAGRTGRRAAGAAARPALPLLRLAEPGWSGPRRAAGICSPTSARPARDELPAHAHADTLGCVRARGRHAAADRHRHLHLRGRAGPPTASGRPRRTTPPRWTAVTPPRCGARSGPAAGPGYWPCRPVPRAAGVTVEAAHDGYRHLAGRPCHRRRWTLTDGGLQVDDWVTGAGRHEVAVRWHLPPATDIRLADGGAIGQHSGREVRGDRGRDSPVTSSESNRPRSPPASCGPRRRRSLPAGSAPACRCGSAPAGAGLLTTSLADGRQREDHRAAGQGRPGRGARRAAPGPRSRPRCWSARSRR